MLQTAANKCRQAILHPSGNTDSARVFESSRAAQMLKGLDRELAAVNVKMVGTAGKAMSAAWARGVAEADKQVKAAGIGDKPGSPFTGSFNLVDSSRAKVLIRETTGDINKAVASIRDTTRTLVRQTHALGLNDAKLNQILAGGTIEGTPAATLMDFKKAVRAAAIDGRIITVNTRTGVAMHFKPDDYAEMVFQTKQAEATNIATMERLQAKKMFYVKIIGSNSLNFCTEFVGKVFYTGDGEDPLGHFPRYGTLPRGGPPFHPRCTKRPVAFIPALATAEEIEAAKLSDGEKALLNTDSNTAQKRFEQKPKQPPAPPAPEDRSADFRQDAADARRTLREIETGFDATIARLTQEHGEIVQGINAAIDKNDGTAIDALVPRAQEVVKSLHDSHAQRRESGLAVLKVKEPIRTEYVLDSSLGPERKKIAQQGLEEFSNLVDRAVAPKLSAIVRVPDVSLGMGNRSYYYEGKLHLGTTVDTGVVVHELSHQLEDMSPGLHAAAIEFLQRRTAGERSQNLKKLTGLNYRPNERAWPDDFFNPYVGKDYGGRATEILSMGLENIWRDPFELARNDPEFFEFIYKAVRGVFK